MAFLLGLLSLGLFDLVMDAKYRRRWLVMLVEFFSGGFLVAVAGLALATAP